MPNGLTSGLRVFTKVPANNNENDYVEIHARFLVFQVFCLKDHHIQVLLRLDNTIAVSYIIKWGLQIYCMQWKAKTIWQWWSNRSISITAPYLLGVENLIADKKSREFRDHLEWMLNESIFRQKCEKFGETDIHLFASRLNAQIYCFVSRKLDPGAHACDVFSIHWYPFLLCFFAILP